MNRSRLRRTILLATAGALCAGIAAAVIVGLTGSGTPSPIVNVTPAASPPALADASDASAVSAGSSTGALEAAADALGFRQSNQPDVGLVENLPPDAPLMAPSATMLAVGAIAPDFVLSTPAGEQVRLSDYRGKTVLLEFFATWCPHCQAEAPHLVRLFAALPSRDFAFLSVNADGEDAASLYAFHRYFHIPWPTLLDPGTTPGNHHQAGGAGAVTRAYGIGLYPAFYIINPQGRVAWRNDREQPDMLLSMKLHEAAGK